MKEKFDVNRLRVESVEDQNKSVENVVKAETMARMEKKHRECAGLYSDYLKDPKLFENLHSATPELRTMFGRLAGLGVPAEYLRRIGELRAEVEGDVYDFENRIRAYSWEALLDLEHALIFDMDDTFFFGSLEQIDATELIYDSQPPRVERWLQMTAAWFKLKAVETELTRRELLSAANDNEV